MKFLSMLCYAKEDNNMETYELMASQTERSDTARIQQTIDTLSRQGKPVTLVFRKGIYHSGALFLKKNVSLHFDEGAHLIGSDDIKEYPTGPTRFEGRTAEWPCALLNCDSLESFSITGEGIIDGNGYRFWKEFWERRDEAIKENKPFTNRDVPRPRLLYISHCSHITVQGITLLNAGFWNFHLYDCDDVTVDHITVQSPHGNPRAASTDGIDIDACRNVLLKNSSFQVDDDCICIKGGKGPTAHTDNPETRDITIEHCHVGFGHGMVTFGSEANIVKNVVVRDMLVDGENTAIRFKFRDDTYQYFEHILFENITMKESGWLFGIRPWISRQDEILGKGLPSTITDLTVRNVIATDMKSPGIIEANPPQVTIRGVTLENITITTLPGSDGSLTRHDKTEAEKADPKKLAITNVESLIRRNCTIDGKDFSF